MKLEYGINTCTNSEYHGDRQFMSSSNLKQLLKDPAVFYKERILGEAEPQKERAAFTEGSLVHSLILEPHMVEAEYAFFDGMRKQGKDWEAFKAAHADSGKTLMSKPQKMRCEFWVDSYKKNKIAQELITGGEPEHTICHNYEGLDLKVRTDYINIDKGYIVDVKTSAFLIDQDSFAMTVDQWSYHLSAAMYCKIAELEYDKRFDFYFVVISKKEQDCQVYKLSKRTYARGASDMAKAIAIYKQCMDTGIWKRSEPEDKAQEEILEI